jgi:hypothetical protein
VFCTNESRSNSAFESLINSTPAFLSNFFTALSSPV